jgi:hypothetical protein
MIDKPDNDPTKWYELIHPGSCRGVIDREPKYREQDAFAQPGECYAVVFFPKLDFLAPASMDWPRTRETIASTPEFAIARFMDGIKRGETWATYQDGGHKVRRIQLVDLGDPEPQPAQSAADAP